MNIYSQVVYGVVEVQQDVARLRELLPADTYADMAICVTDQDGVPVLQPAQGIEEMKNPYTVTKTSTAYGWSVSLTQSGRAMIAPYQPLFIGIAVGCTVLVLLVAAVIWLVARRLTAPLVSLRRAVGDISYADVGGLAQPLVGNESMDEVRELNIAFDAMLSRIGESVELEKKAMLLALQSQMNPHFFHNIMTVISGAAMEGKDEQVVRMCTQVCDMSRYIASFEEGDVTVQQELQHLQNYLELMKARYEDLFSYDKNKIRFSIYPYLFIAPTVILIGIFSYYAMFNGIYTSLTDYRISYSEISFIGLENYKTLFSPDGALFWLSFKNQVIITVTSVLKAVFFPLLTAELLFFVRHKKVADTIKSMFVIPMLVPGIVSTLIWRFLYNKDFGFNSLLQLLGLKSWQHNWMNDEKTALLSIILMGFPFVAGLNFLIFPAAVNNVGQELYEAAKIDGASEVQTYGRIALPLSVPTLITIGVTCVTSMYNDYIWPALVLTKGDKIKTFCQIVFNNAAGNGTSDYGMVTAAFVIGTLPLLAVTLSCLKYYLAGMLQGAVKG